MSIEDYSRRLIRTTLQIIDYKAKRRDKLIIMMEIIAIARKGASKTHIMFKANLSFSQLKEYIDFLTKKSLLQKASIDRRTVYKSTEKGLEFMEKQQHVIGMLSDNFCEAKIFLLSH